MRNQQAQIEALEHFVLVVFKELDQKHGLPLSRIVDSAKSSVLSSQGAGALSRNLQQFNTPTV